MDIIILSSGVCVIPLMVCNSSIVRQENIRVPEEPTDEFVLNIDDCCLELLLAGFTSS